MGLNLNFLGYTRIDRLWESVFQLWEKMKEGKIDASIIPDYENILEAERKK
jgi:hypothetical protein